MFVNLFDRNWEIASISIFEEKGIEKFDVSDGIIVLLFIRKW